VYDLLFRKSLSTLAAGDLPRLCAGKNGQDLSVVRAQLDIGKGGKVRLKLGTTKRQSVWLDGQTVPVKETRKVELCGAMNTFEKRLLQFC